MQERSQKLALITKKVSTKVVAPYGLGVSGNGNVAR
jgi:hypothetical protein